MRQGAQEDKVVAGAGWQANQLSGYAGQLPQQMPLPAVGGRKEKLVGAQHSAVGSPSLTPLTDLAVGSWRRKGTRHHSLQRQWPLTPATARAKSAL